MEFWTDFSLIAKILFCTGLASTAVLLVQIILLIIGFAAGSFGDADGFDTDFDGDIDADDLGGSGIGWFTIKGLVAFFSIGSWTGFAMDVSGCHEALTICISLLTGVIALVGVGLLYRAMNKLQSNGILNLKNAIGKEAEVYLTIPANNSGVGKVTLEVQDRLIEVNARTNKDCSIPTGSTVKVVSVSNGELIVE